MDFRTKVFEVFGRCTTRQLDTLGKRMHDDGKFGCDYAPLTKSQKANFLYGELPVTFGAFNENDPQTQQNILAWLNGLVDGIREADNEPGQDDPDDGHGNAAATQTLGEHDPDHVDVESDLPSFKYEPGKDDGKPCDDENCQFREGAGTSCPSFPYKGKCPECDVPFVDAPHHEPGCSMEQKLNEHHADGLGGQGQGQAQAPHNCLIPGEIGHIEELAKAVALAEFSPTFKNIETAFNAYGALIKANAQVANESLENSLEALKLVKATKRQKIVAAAGQSLKFEFADLPPFSLEGRHPRAFPQLMALMRVPDWARQPVLMWGEAGGGKSTLAEHVAMALGLFPDHYSAQSGTADMMSGKVFGRILPIGTGQYLPSELVRRLLALVPFLFHFDEYDVVPGEIQVGMNTFLAGDAMYVEERSFVNEPVRIVKPPGTYILASGNTPLTGATARYNSRQQADGANRDRWLCLHVEENPAVPAGICGADYIPLEPWVPQEYSQDELSLLLKDAYKMYVELKDYVAKNDVQQTVTPRWMLRARHALWAGFTWDETRQILFTGWGKDELDQVGHGDLIHAKTT